MATKTRFPRAEALDVVREILPLLEGKASRVLVAGSLRRRKAEVGDIEILYIPIVGQVADPGDLFGAQKPTNLVDAALAEQIAAGKMEKRPNVAGATMWGAQNKLARHVASGIPLDFFAATPENWWNLVVCRTGGAESNMQICNAAIEIGWKWNPYGMGFSRPSWTKGGFLDVYEVKSEEEVFTFVGLEYREPWDRK